MTPLPKRKHSHGRTHRRRSHDALKALRLVECPACHQLTLQHRACTKCGEYRGKAIVAVAQE